MKNELRRHKKSDRVKWVIAFAAILLLAAGLTLICLQLFTPYKPSNGFKQADAVETFMSYSGIEAVEEK